VVLPGSIGLVGNDGLMVRRFFLALRRFYEAMNTEASANNSGAFLYPRCLPCFLHDFIINHSSEQDEQRWLQ
jgi:hypothetical protein